MPFFDLVADFDQSHRLLEIDRLNAGTQFYIRFDVLNCIFYVPWDVCHCTK